MAFFVQRLCSVCFCVPTKQLVTIHKNSRKTVQWKILDNFHVANDLGSKNATPACVASFSPKDLDGKPKLKTKTTLASKKQTNHD